MTEWCEAKKEMLQSLYRYRVMSPHQLSILLGYQLASMYRVGSELQKQGWASSVLLPFLGGNSKAY